MTTIVLFGATGFVGQNLAAAAARAGHTVIGISLSGGPVEGAGLNFSIAAIDRIPLISDVDVVAIHVAAKRYLCGAEADYFGKLSPDSVRSLALQGGPMNAAELAAFMALPFAADAVKLRRFDEGAKVKGLETPIVGHFLPSVARRMTPEAA